jgi:Ran GTPase-activating protein (RanGAP) involved in mRNA processing and transport
LQKVLDLSWNHVRAGSGVSLAASLKVNTMLHTLNIEYNTLGAEGVSRFETHGRTIL